MLICGLHIGTSTFHLFLPTLHRPNKKLPTVIQLGLKGFFILNEEGIAFHLIRDHSPGLADC